MEVEEDELIIHDEPSYSERYVGSKEELESLTLERKRKPSSEDNSSQKKSTKERIYVKGLTKNRRTRERLKSCSMGKGKLGKNLKSVTRPLGLLLFKHTYHHLLIACFLFIIVETSRFAQPFLMLIIIRRHPTTNPTTQYGCALGIIVHNLLQATMMTYGRHLLDVTAIKVKVLLTRIIYTKVPALTKSSQSDLNLNYLSLSADVDKLCQVFTNIPSALVGILSLITSSCVLLAFYGVYSLPSLGVVLLTVLLRIYTSTYKGNCMIQAVLWTKSRLMHLSELISNFNIIKINCSENVYKDRLINAESKEFPMLHRAFALSGLNLGVGFMTTRLAIYITIVTLARDGNDMAFQGLFLLVSYLQTLEFHGITRLPMGIGSLTYAISMIRRLQDILDGRSKTHRREPREKLRLDEPPHSSKEMDEIQNGVETEQLILTRAPTSFSPTAPERGIMYRWIFLYFLKAGPGLVVFPIMLTLSILSELLGISSEWWISKCRESYTVGGGPSSGVIYSNKSFQEHLKLFENGTLFRHVSTPLVDDLPGYTGLSLTFVILELISMVLFIYLIAVTVNKLLFKMRAGVLDTKSSCLANIHSGAILEAFGGDFHYIFDSGANFLYINYIYLVRVVCYLLFACVIYPWIAIPTLPFMTGLFLLKIYMKEKLGQIEKREHALQDSLLTRFGTESPSSWDTSVKRHLAMEKHRWYSLTKAKSWLRLKVNLFTSFYSACIILQLVSCSQRIPTMGTAGLLYIYVSKLIFYIQDIVSDPNTFTNCINRMRAIASLPSEPMQGSGNWCDWPGSGSVNFLHVKLPSCLHKEAIDCDIPSGKKVGLLATEGCYRHGFVSAILALEDHIGSARVDNVDTSAVNVHSLRTGISLIHKSLLMKGISMRQFLDPMKQFTNERILEVFEQLSLKRGLESVALEGDLGEVCKELNETSQNNLCVARAVLHGSKVVIVWEDESDADRSVDSNLQYIIRQHLPSATRIKVTPSVRSVITCDSILVIDDGKLEKYPCAWHLLVYNPGIYETLVREVGKDEAVRIKAVTTGFYRDRAAMDTIQEAIEEEEEEDEALNELEDEEKWQIHF